MTEQQIQSATDDQLFQWMYNALATTSCSGHFKAFRNECRARIYRDELIKRGHDIPEIDFWETFDHEPNYHSIFSARGTYNGEGAC